VNPDVRVVMAGNLGKVDDLVTPRILISKTPEEILAALCCHR
jgi:hypothetical protein